MSFADHSRKKEGFMKTVFTSAPGTHSSENGHWNEALVTSLDGKTLHAQIRFQNGPINEHGVNGVQLTDVLKVCLARYQMLNRSFPCRENSVVITKLQEAIMWDEERTAQRTLAGVEGFDKPH